MDDRNLSHDARVVVESDFEADLAELLRDQLRAHGIPSEGCTDAHSLCVRLIDATSRMVPPKPRAVHISRELSCPKQLRPGLDTLLNNVRQGADLSPWLSTAPWRLIGSPKDKNDPLLRAWGIHHFHLGTSIGAGGHVKRTSQLLFAHVTDTDFYAVDVMKHGDWAEQRLLDILDSNWPGVLSHFQLRGVRPATSFTKDDILLMRDGHINILATASDGTVYAPIGGGVTSAGTSVQATRVCDMCIAAARDLEQQLNERPQVLTEAAAVEGVQLGATLALQMTVEHGQFVAIERDSGVKFILGPVP